MENFGKYIIERKIGEGATATVYLAKDSVLKRDVALKIMKNKTFGSSIDFKKLFIDEAQRIAKLNHKNIIQVYDAGIEDQLVYLAMEYLAGGTLKERMTQGRPFDSITVLREIAEALEYAYKNNSIIHRDLKPANIIFRQHLDGEIEAVLTDFGISKTEGVDSDFTEIDVNVGTPRYMSPEQLMRVPIDNRSDLYTLGIIFYEMLVGEKPFPESNTSIGIKSKISNPPPKLPENNKKYQVIINKLIAPHVNDRHSSAKELIQAIDQIKTPVKSLATKEKTNKNQYIAISLIGIILFGAGTGTYLFITQKNVTNDINHLKKLTAIAKSSKQWIDIEQTNSKISDALGKHPDNKEIINLKKEINELQEFLKLEATVSDIEKLYANQSYEIAKTKIDELLTINHNFDEINKRIKKLQLEIEMAITTEKLGSINLAIKLPTGMSQAKANPAKNELPEIVISTTKKIHLGCTYQTPKSGEMYRLYPISPLFAETFQTLRPYVVDKPTTENFSINIPYGETEVGSAKVVCFGTLTPMTEFMDLFESTDFALLKKEHSVSKPEEVVSNTIPHIRKEITIPFF